MQLRLVKEKQKTGVSLKKSIFLLINVPAALNKYAFHDILFE